MTVKDIAKACGVSANTVSRAMNDKPDVSPETKKKILKYVEKVGFIPNYQAKSLSSKQRFLIGFIYYRSQQPANLYLMNFIMDYAHTHGFGVICKSLDYIMEQPVDDIIKVIDSISIHNPQGIIIDADALSKRTDDILQILKKRKIPLVIINSTEKIKGCQVVIKDTGKASYLSTKYLLDKGYKNIVYVGWSKKGTGICNFAGYKQAYEEKKIKVKKELLLDTSEVSEPKDNRQRLDIIGGMVCEKFRTYGKIGVYCTTMQLAAQVEKMALKNGLQIPRDLCIVSLEDDPMNNALLVPLTCCVTDYKKIAEKAVQFTINQQNRTTGSYDAKWTINEEY